LADDRRGSIAPSESAENFLTFTDDTIPGFTPAATLADLLLPIPETTVQYHQKETCPAVRPQ